ncbi:MAG: hypothetical protein JWN41_1752 [Thermoleophilia bacterium]|nr:hypothetical protein [Thermoleophilia bacterium]
MAEQEVIKHTKKVFQLWGNNEHSLLHKIGEFLLEIFIIVFAISLSLWFHNRSEHQHAQEEVEAFLKGLRQDLGSDIKEMHSDMESYGAQQAAYRYISSTPLDTPLRLDSLGRHYRWLFGNTVLNPNSGRFEGFKSSGKIGTIEDDTLQNDIMDLYQENIPQLLAVTRNYIEQKNRLQAYMQVLHRRLSDSTTNIAEVLNTEEAHNICGMLTVTGEITARYKKAVQKMEKIIATIDQHYPPGKEDAAE